MPLKTSQPEVLLVGLVSHNLEGLSAFIDQLMTYDGAINFQYLYRVRENGSSIKVVRCSENNHGNNLAIIIGGEVPNSFCTIYEAAYFFEALFLSAVGTAYLLKFGIPNHNRSASVIARNEIKSNLSLITNDELFVALQKPAISIISSLDTDIEPYRYVKHQLWRLEENALWKRCSDVTNDDFGKQKLDEGMRGLYWVEGDRDVAECAMSNADTLAHAKAIQYHLTLKQLLRDIGIDLSNIPLYFNFVPREEILLLGPSHDFLKTVIALHERNFRKILSKITKADYPWIISISCPRCHESSKKVIRANLRPDCRSIHLVCSQYPQEYRNESGFTMVRKGCGYSWDLDTPSNSEELYQLFVEKSPTLNIAVRFLLAVIKSTADCPISWPLTELGIVHNCVDYVHGQVFPKGFGDHRDLITSVLMMQHLLTRGMIIPEFSHELIEKRLITSREMQVFSWAGKMKLADPEISCQDKPGINVTDTSVLKVIERGLSANELFRKSIDINEVKLNQLLKLQKRGLRDIL